MLFMCAGKARPGLSMEDRQKVLQLFRSWVPPAGLEIKGHYVNATGGDYVLVETDSVEPIIAVQDGIGRLARAEETRRALL